MLKTGDLPVDMVERLLQDVVVPAYWPRGELTRVEVSPANFIVGEERSAICTLQVQIDGVTETVERVYVRFFDPSRFLRESVAVADSKLRDLCSEDFHCTVRLFPSDPDLPGLRRLFDPDYMRGVLSPLLLDENEPAANFELDIQALHHKPGRHCLAAYHLRQASGATRYNAMAKVLRNGRRSRRLWDVLVAAYYGSPVRPVPEPLAHLPERGVVLMEHLNGQALNDILASGSERDIARATRLTARSMAALHATPMSHGKPGAIEDEVASLRKHTREFEQTAPDHTLRADEMLTRVLLVAPHLRPARLSVVHSGFTPPAVMISEDRAALVDLDGWELGDPAFDLGSYLTAIWDEAPGAEGEQASRHGDLLISEYERHALVPVSRPRIRMYEALTLIRLAMRQLRKHHASPALFPAGDDLDEVLDRAESRLLLAEAGLEH